MKKIISLVVTVSTLYFSACSDGNGSGNSGGPAPEKFSSCAQLKEYIKSVNEKNQAPTPATFQTSGTGVSGSAEAGGPSQSADLSFVNQEDGVQEGDFIAKNSDAIFIARGNELQVIDRVSLKSRGKLKIEFGNNPKVFVSADKLVVVTTNGSTEVSIYQTKKSALPELLSKESLKGRMVDLRFMGSNLVLVLNDYLSEADSSNEKFAGVKCDCFYRPFSNDYLSVSKIFQIDVNKSALPVNTLAVIGAAGDLYMTKDKIFLNATSYSNWRDSTQITQLAMVEHSLSENKLALTAIGQISGYLKDRFSLKWYADKNTLVAATTSSINNYLVSLTPVFEQLKVVNQTESFGVHEDIRAVRFQDDLALVVTFKKTDPLFAFDMKDPGHPKLVSELKMPGFSSALYPISDKYTIGLGYDAADMGTFAWFQGIQLSVFEVSCDKNLERKDVKVFGDRGSHSEATFEPHAFYQDNKRKRFAFPLTEMVRESSTPYEYGTKVSFHGAVIYKVAEEGKLLEEARITHDKFIPKECLNNGGGYFSSNGHKDISRIMKLDSRLITISQFGIMQHDDERPTTLVGEFAFPVTPENPCFNLYGGYCGNQ